MRSKDAAQQLLSQAGITINGGNPYDPQVHDERTYDRVLSRGTLGLGEAYMDGWWDVEDLAGFISRVFRSDFSLEFFNVGAAFLFIKAKLMNLQNPARAFQVGERHYDIGNDLYAKMLDPRMIYSCGYWKDAKDLAGAQTAKLDLICRKVGLKAGDRILDVGCGWGGFAEYAAREYGANVVGITISKEQAELARERTKGLPVETRLQDWRDLVGETFDHIISIGMFEHVGVKNYKAFFKKMHSLIADDGLFLLHTIGQSRTTAHNDPWFDKYIFPNGHIPSLLHIAEGLKDSKFDRPPFIVEDWHNFGTYYDNTLMAWHENFEKAWPQLRGSYDERFRRMWRYYLLTCAGTFRARILQLWQITLSKKGLEAGYTSIR